MNGPLETVLYLILSATCFISGLYLARTLYARLLAHSIPELSIVDSEEERLNVLNLAMNRVGDSSAPPGPVHRVLWQGGARAFVREMPFLVVGFILLSYSVPLWAAPPILLLVMPAFTLTKGWLGVEETRKAVRGYLLLRGVLVCLNCGYDLRGQEVPRCPECGWECDARVRGIMRVAKMRRERS